MHRIVPALEQARVTQGRKAKVAALVAALRAVAADGEDDDLATAARVVAGIALPVRDAATLGVGFALVVASACEAYGLSPADVHTKARALGDLGDALGELASSGAGASERVGLSLAELSDLASALARVTDRTAKGELLRDAYIRARADQAKYLTKVLLGELRIGVREGTLEEAIAQAFGRSLKDVQAASLFCTDPGELAVLARHDELSRAVFVPGSPVAFMLASPSETVKSPVNAATTVWEDKLDGIRVQLHVRAGEVKLFARGGGEVSRVFPEVTRAFAGLSRDVVLDGEILAVTNDLRPRPFQALQARLNRKDPDAALLLDTPVALFAFDMLYDGEALLAAPWSHRRARLAAFFDQHAFAPGAQATDAHPFEAEHPLEAQIDAAFEAARARGHEGLVLKEASASYEAGRRGSAWRKVKRALATLDVVITRAEQGHGKRAGVLSDYTFAVRKPEREAAEGELVELGKAYSGLTDEEIATLTPKLVASTREERGGQRFVEPGIVLEIAFDGLQPSKRHSSGFALRFPRIVRIRDDKSPAEVDTLATVEAIFATQVASGHREEEATREKSPTKPTTGPSTKKGRAKGVPTAQLDLFSLTKK